MGSFKASEIDNYGGQGGSGYFSLKNDKDVAQVRFMYTDVEDINGYAVHEAQINDKRRWVNCLRTYHEPLDKCPFCRAGKPQLVKLFIPIYDVDEQRVKVWERGKKFYSNLSGTFSRVKGSIVSNIFEIERNGKQGDTATTYGIYQIDRDDTSLEDLPELPKIYGGLVLEKSAEDMEYYLQEGMFPPEDGDDVPVRRRNGSTSNESVPVRRTPARSRRSDGDAF